MLFNIYGIVLREIPVKDNDKFLTVLTSDRGIMSIYAYGVRNFKNKCFQAARLMCYNEFVIDGRDGRYTMKEASLLDDFHGLHDDLVKLALAQYICESAAEVCVENSDESAQLQLVLNALYMLEHRDFPAELLKGAYELRLMCGAGYMPDLISCCDCGCVEASADGKSGYFCLDVENGVIRCGECFSKLGIEDRLYEDGREKYHVRLSGPTLEAMRYTVLCVPKRLFAFRLEENYRREFSYACETYLLYHVDKSFKTLEFLKTLM